MLFKRDKLTEIKFYTQFLLELFFYLPFFILFIFKKKDKNNLTFFLVYKFRKYKDHPENFENYDDINIVNNYRNNTKSLSKMYFVDTSNKFKDFMMNIKIIYKIYSENPRYFVCFSDYGNERFNLSIAVLYLISKFKLSEMLLISTDSIWKINILRAKIFEKNN